MMVTIVVITWWWWWLWCWWWWKLFRIKVLIFSGGSFEWQRGRDFNSFTSDKRTSFSHIHHPVASCFLKHIWNWYIVFISLERYLAISLLGGQSKLAKYIWYDIVFFSDYLDIIIIICFAVSTFGQVFGLLEAGGQSKLAAEDHSANRESSQTVDFFL